MTKKIVALALVAVCVLSLAATAFAGRVDLAKIARIQNGIAQCRAAISRCQQTINSRGLPLTAEERKWGTTAASKVANAKRLKSSYQSQLNQLYVMLRQAQYGY